MRTLILSILVPVTFSGILNLSLLAGPAVASGDSDLDYRLKSTRQQLLSQKQDLERDMDEIACEISRLEHVRDYNSVSRALDDLQKKKHDAERREQDVLIDIRNIENDLRACK